MALTFFWRCEDTTLDATHDYSAGDTTASLINSGALDAAASYRGTLGKLKPDGFSGGALFSVASIYPGTHTAPADGVGAFGCVARWPSGTRQITGVTQVVRVYNAALTEGIEIQCTNSANNIGIRSVKSGVGTYLINTSGGQVASNTWLGIVARFDYPGNRFRLEIYNAATGALLDSVETTGAGNFSGQNFDYYAPSALSWWSFGVGTGTAGFPLHADNFFVGNTYDEPIQENFGIASYTEYGVSQAAGNLHLQNLQRGFGPARAAGLGGILQ